jgi:hypothetical protein
LSRHNVINQLIHMHIKHNARTLIEKLPADKHERNLLRNNVINKLVYLQIISNAWMLTEKLPADKYNDGRCVWV